MRDERWEIESFLTNGSCLNILHCTIIAQKPQGSRNICQPQYQLHTLQHVLVVKSALKPNLQDRTTISSLPDAFYKDSSRKVLRMKQSTAATLAAKPSEKIGERRIRIERPGRRASVKQLIYCEIDLQSELFLGKWKVSWMLNTINCQWRY